MKILLDIRGPRRGGSWTYTKSLVPELVRHGNHHDFTILYDPFQEKFGIEGVKEEVIPFTNKIKWMDFVLMLKYFL